MPIRAAFLTLLAAFTGWLVIAAPVSAAERITLFSSDIEVTPGGALLVTETLNVQVEGRQIKRGIYRDFPTNYKDRAGNNMRVGMKVLEVRRDGRPEPYIVQPRANGMHIRIGRADRLLSHGPHAFVIKYKTTRQIGFFKDFDELYWNVTGSDWAFPIDAVEARVTLPGRAEIIQHTAYTGPPGTQGKDYLESIDPGRATFQTTRTLAPGEGLTIAIAWPKGIVAQPSAAQRFDNFFSDNATTGAALAGLLIVLAYYLFIWRKVGRDPETGVVFPRYTPPVGLSPAAARYVRHMAFDQKAYTAAIINMAVKGYVTINEGDDGNDGYSLTKKPDGDLHALSKGEKNLSKKLFDWSGSILFDRKNHVRIGGSLRALKKSLKGEFEKSYFLRNQRWFAAGFVLSVASIIANGFLAVDPAPTIILGLIISGISAFFSYLALRLFAHRLDPVFGGGGGITKKLGAVLGISFANIVFIALPFFFMHDLLQSGGIWTSGGTLIQIICFAALGFINVLFYYLLKAPTRAGRAIMDEIEGFRLYLAVAEQDRMNMAHPPDKTPALFEKYLPFALALDVENKWSEQFADVLAAASQSTVDGGQGYRPRWYRGAAWNSRHVAQFSSTLSADFTQAMAASATAPGSSSGSGGGGSSGGGGGGGGGGGW